MSLDNNLFTLWIGPDERNPQSGDVVLTDPQSSEPIYLKRRRQIAKGPDYCWSLWDPVSEAMLATVMGLSPTAKTKTITLHDPEIPVQLSFSGTMSFKWTFEWEGHEFEWKKESCYLLRKPDPPVQVAVTDAAKKGKPASVQVLDYNLRRFDIDDKKGLEIVMLCALLSFSDYTEGFNNQAAPAAARPAVPSGSGARIAGPSAPPVLTPPPAAIIPSSAERNEIIVTEDGAAHDYAQHCANVLGDPDILFIIIRSHNPEVVPKVVAIAEATKRLRHRVADADEELFQYLTYDQEDESKKKKRVIKLDDKPDPKKNEYKPLNTLTIHISKIPIPELGHQNQSSSRPSPSSAPPAKTRPPNGKTPLTLPSRPPASSNNSSGSGARLQKPAPNGKHGRSSSAERPSASSNYPNNGGMLAPNPNPNARPGVAGGGRQRPVSAYGAPVGGQPYGQMPMPYGGQQPGQLPPGGWQQGWGGAPPQQPQPQQQQQQQSGGLFGKLFGK
ncbi:hypothetical protein DL93DRAFT_2077390 [Clavulina sp. PMI_390]|nr:hypothetical protein DL93DRAFT_2077390 [Clavulina sp. PMI_390]